MPCQHEAAAVSWRAPQGIRAGNGAWIFGYVSSTDGIHHVAASDGSSASFGIGGNVRLVCGVRSAGGA